jgi:hypothetical protein
MTLVVTFEDKDGGTEVTIAFKNIPPGYDPQTMMPARNYLSRSWLAMSRRKRQI